MSVAFRASLAAVVCIALSGVLSVVRLQQLPTAGSGNVVPLPEGGRYEETEAAARSQVSSLRDAYGDNSVEVIKSSDVLVRALRLNGKGTADETLRLAQRTLAMTRAHFGTMHAATAVSLMNLGQVLSDRGDHHGAIAQLQQALRIREKLKSSTDLETAEILDALGLVLVRARSYDAALGMLRRSIQIKELARPPNPATLTHTLEMTTAALQGKGDYRGARETLDRVLSMRGGPGQPHPSEVTFLNLLAMQLWYEGEPLRSRAVSFRALQVAEQSLRADHPEIARTLQVLAATIDDLGDVVNARTYRERALAIAQRSLGATHYELASFLNDLGDVNRLLGAYTDAKDQFERALRIAEAALEPQHDWIPMIVHNLALVDASLGDFAAARREHTRAIAMWERALGPDHPFLAVALTELASVLREQGAAAEALPLFERALVIRQRALGDEHRDSARTMADIASTLSQLGEYDRAQAIAARALAIWERIDTTDAPDLAIVLKLYADLQVSQGAHHAARPYFERALTIRRKIFGPSHPQVAEVEAALALVDARIDNGLEAVSLAKQAETTGREHLRLMLRYLPEREGLNYAANRPRALDLLLSLPGTSKVADVAFDALIRSRALVLDEMAARGHLMAAPADSLSPLRAELMSAQQQFANLVVRGPKGEATDRYMTLVQEARRNKEAAERVLAARSATFRAAVTQAQTGLPDVRQRIERDAVLVSFVRYGRIPLSTAANVATPASPHTEQPVPSYLAFVLRHGAEPIAIPLGPAHLIEPLVARWRSEIAAAGTMRQDMAQTAERSVRAAGEQLRSVVWDPLVQHLGGVRTVFIVPDGALSLLPVSALPGRKVEFLLEETPVLHYLSAERDLITAPPASSARGLLALGGADFNWRKTPMTGAIAAPRPTSAGSARSGAAPSNCGGLDGLQPFQPLSGTLQEVTDIAQLWTAQTGTATEDARILSRAQADERTFKQDAPRHRVLHLATHGFFLRDSCHGSTEGLRSVGAIVPKSNGDANTSGPEADVSENPLLRSGLALAGANRRHAAEADEEDGILTAEEVASLNLDGVEWAVLSACDTGLGQIRAGEGVLGLRRAFQIAGARTVIMSLWAVDDQATRTWMHALYDGRLNKRLDTADAVREASLTVLRERRSRGQSTHPFYWAAFVAAGDWH